MSTKSLQINQITSGHCVLGCACCERSSCETWCMVKVRMGLRRRGLLAAQAVGVPAKHRGLGANAHREAAQGVRVLPSAVGAERGWR